MPIPKWLEIEPALPLKANISQAHEIVAQIIELMHFNDQELSSVRTKAAQDDLEPTSQAVKITKVDTRKSLLRKFIRIKRDLKSLSLASQADLEKLSGEMVVGRLQILKLKILDYLEGQGENHFPSVKAEGYHYAPIFVRELQEGYSLSFQQLLNIPVSELTDAQRDSLEAQLYFFTQMYPTLLADVTRLKMNLHLETELPTSIDQLNEVSTNAQRLGQEIIRWYQLPEREAADPPEITGKSSKSPKKKIISYYANFLNQITTKITELNQQPRG